MHKKNYILNFATLQLKSKTLSSFNYISKYVINQQELDVSVCQRVNKEFNHCVKSVKTRTSFNMSR